MTDEFIKDKCVKNLCTMLRVPEHEFLPHYVTINEFLSKMNTEGAGKTPWADDTLTPAQKEVRGRTVPGKILDGHF